MTDEIKNAPPSIDPANYGSMTGLLQLAFEKLLQNVDDMLPARVVAFNGDRNAPRVQVEILYLVTASDGQVIPMAQAASLPVVQMSGGGFILSFPIKPGDLGWVKANDQDISLFLRTFKASPGNTKRMHSFEDAVFIPDAMRGYSIAGADADSCVLQSMDGSVKLTLSTTAIRMQSGSNYVDVSAAGVAIVSPPGTLTHNGKNIGDTHRHSGVTSGPSNTGVPI